MTGLVGLFFVAFLAATPFPIPSEPAFLLMLAADWPMWPVVAVASTGNVLGSLVTWGLGRWAGRYSDRPWFPLRGPALAKAQGWWQRWGIWTLLLSWAPGGDVVVAFSGLLRAPFWQVLVLLTIAKTGRYVALALAAAAVV